MFHFNIGSTAISSPKVYSTATDAATDKNAIESVSGSYADNGNTIITKESGNDWSGKFYRIVYNLSSSASSKNYGIILNSATFYTESAATGRVDASWSVSPTEISVMMGNTASATITTNYDGELIAETNNSSVATCSFEDGVLTVTGVSVGTTTITFLGEETSKYNEIEKEVTVNVTEPVAFDPSNFVIADFEKAIPAATDGNITFSLGDYSFELKKNNGGSAPTVNTTAHDMRIYAQGTITISSVTKVFDGVVFNLSSQGLKRLAPITADCGTVATQTSGDETVTWTSATPVSSVTFTVGDNANYGSDGSSKAGQLDFTSMSITEAEAPTSGTLEFKATGNGKTYWATFSTNQGVLMPSVLDDENTIISVYAVFAQSNTLSLKDFIDDFECTDNEGNIFIPANTGVLVKAQPFDEDIEITKSLTYSYTNETYGKYEAGWNLLVPAAVDMTGDNKFYKLAKNSAGKLGFFYGNEGGAAFTMNNTNGAYLAVPSYLQVKAFTLDDIETAIQNVETNKYDTKIFNLQGQRVSKTQKGLYIINGRKVVK